MADDGATRPTADAELVERRVAGMRWLVVRGPRDRCFRALGAHAGDAIRRVVDNLDARTSLPAAGSNEENRARLEAVARASAARYPEHVGELAAMAEGAGVPFESLLLLNLLDDLGKQRRVAPSDGGGCSDVAVIGDHTVLAHNEDEDLSFLGRIDLVTLRVDGDPPLWALWYPGMLPGDAFTLTGSLAWGVNHLPVTPLAAPVAAPGREFVARALQKAGSIDDAVALLRSERSAGGFAYTIADGATGKVVTVETVAGEVAVEEGDVARLPVLWHTNHVRYLPAGSKCASDSSLVRGRVLADAVGAAAQTPLGEPRLLGMLTTPLPGGVRQEGRIATLCTVVADVTAGEVLIAPGLPAAGTFAEGDGEPERVKIADLLAGSLPPAEPTP